MRLEGKLSVLDARGCFLNLPALTLHCIDTRGNSTLLSFVLYHGENEGLEGDMLYWSFSFELPRHLKQVKHMQPNKEIKYIDARVVGD